MHSATVDPSAILDRIVAGAMQNLRIEKILLQLGLDPSNITFDAVANRLLDVAVSHITLANMLALTGAIFFVATLMVRTIVPLRIIGIISNVFFIAYGALAGSMATFFLYLLSLPINAIRLRQMLTLVKKARVSAQGDLSMDWLRPFMSPRKYRKGDVLFHKNDAANEMFMTITGKFLVKEIGIELLPGRILGELGFVDPKNRRTQTVECSEDGDVLTITVPGDSTEAGGGIRIASTTQLFNAEVRGNAASTGGGISHWSRGSRLCRAISIGMLTATAIPEPSPQSGARSAGSW